MESVWVLFNGTSISYINIMSSKGGFSWHIWEYNNKLTTITILLLPLSPLQVDDLVSPPGFVEYQNSGA